LNDKLKLNWGEYLDLYILYEHPPSTLFHKYVSKKIARYITYPFVLFGISPNTLTFVSFILLVGSVVSLNIIDDHLSACLFFLILSQFSYAIDCSDGVVARITNKASKFGGFLDLSLDRLSSNVLMVGLIYYLYANANANAYGYFYIFIVLLGFISHQYYSYLADIRGFMFKDLKGYTKRQTGKSVQKNIILFMYEFIDTGIFYFLLFLSIFYNLILETFIFYLVISWLLIFANYYVLYQESK